MPIPKATNERIKRAYFEWFQNARGCSPVTANHVGRAIRAFETFTGFKDFRTFDRHQAMAFRKHLSDDPSDATGKILSLATQHATLLHVRAFFRWLSDQSSYRRAVKASDADYLTLSKGERAIAKRRSAPKPFPSCEQVVQALRTLPFDTDLQKRDRALMAFLLLNRRFLLRNTENND